MRSFSLTALAALFFVIVSAAPSESSPFLRIEDILVDGLNDDDMFEKTLKGLKCIRDVIGKGIGDSEFKPLYEEYKQKAEAVVQTDLMKCRGHGEEFFCIIDAVYKFAKVYDEFFNKVSQTNKEFVEKIKHEVSTNCAKQNELFFIAEAYERSFRERYECQIKVLGEASMKNGMIKEWKMYEPKVKQHFAAWKQCMSAGGKLKKLYCNVKEGGYIFGLVVKYSASIRKHPNYKKLEQDYQRLMKVKCLL